MLIATANHAAHWVVAIVPLLTFGPVALIALLTRKDWRRR